MLFTSPENDLAFSVNEKMLILFEHQSTINENMPVRMLTYITRIYEKRVGKKVYRKSLVKLPRPEFIVLYNGKEPFPKEKRLRLSDAFEKIGDSDLISLDLIVRVININKGVNPKLERRSKILDGYVTFIAKVREYEKKYPRKKLEEAIKAAIRYCIKNDIFCRYKACLVFTKQNSSEVVNMLMTEHNVKDAIEVAREEGIEKGIERGIEKGIEKGMEKGMEKTKNYVLDLMAQGLSYEEIKKKIEKIS